MRAVLVQMNPTVGDLEGNARVIGEAIGAHGEADLIVLPELCVCGYPPRDLLLREGFVDACERTAAEVGRRVSGSATVVIGTPFVRADGRLSNGLLVYRDGAELARYAKRLLPTYDVFDEDRYFVAGDEAVVLEIAGESDVLEVRLTACAGGSDVA